MVVWFPQATFSCVGVGMEQVERWIYTGGCCTTVEGQGKKGARQLWVYARV